MMSNARSGETRLLPTAVHACACHLSQACWCLNRSGECSLSTRWNWWSRRPSGVSDASKSSGTKTAGGEAGDVLADDVLIVDAGEKVIGDENMAAEEKDGALARWMLP